MMAFVRSGAAERGMRAPYRLLAMSLGGMVATAWAQRYPDEIERLILVNTSMQPFCSMTQRLRPAAWPALACLAAGWRDAKESEWIIHTLTCHRSDTFSDDIAAWTEIRRTAPVSAVNGLRQLWAAARFRADRQAPHCPVLLLSSASDRLVDPVCSARIAAQWGATHATHPWAGHDLPHDDPQWTSKTIGDWLRGVE
jgi:pimeloyl-ACP methyl ester carboxylesterase